MWAALAASIAASCTVPDTGSVLLERYCAQGGPGNQDQSLRLESAACDRGLTVELAAEGFRPGCVRVSLLDPTNEPLDSLLIETGPGSEPDWRFRLGITLSEAQGNDVKLVARAFERGCDVTVVAEDAHAVTLRKGALQTQQLLLSARDADRDGHVAVENGGTDCDDADASNHEGSRWFVDEDGDGKAGHDVGVHCTAPVPGAVTTSEDCDESSRAVANGLSEVCDRLDNDCDGLADNGLGCSRLTWDSVGGVGTGDLSAVAAYARGGAWFLSGSAPDMFSLDGGVVVPVPVQCTGGAIGYPAAWADTTGQLLTVDRDYGMMTRRPGEPCYLATSESVKHPGFTGVTGVANPDGGPAIAYGVTSRGGVYRWPSFSLEPELMALMPANLQAIDSQGTEDTLVAVGAEALDGGTGWVPRAFRYDPAQGEWRSESLGTSQGQGFLRDVHVLDAQRAHAVGDNGLVLERDSNGWHPLPALQAGTGPLDDLTSVVSFSHNAIYAVSQQGRIHFHGLQPDGGTAWRQDSVGTNGRALRSVDGTSPTDIWAVGDEGALFHFGL
nr:putative metal-binding motif-containing protein [Corallococcus macrosporus]